RTARIDRSIVSSVAERLAAARRSGSPRGLARSPSGAGRRLQAGPAVPYHRGGDRHLEGAVARIVFVTDSASDLDAAVATAAGIRIVPLAVTFGSDTYRAGLDLTTAEFWTRMTAPDAPFPKTA